MLGGSGRRCWGVGVVVGVWWAQAQRAEAASPAGELQPVTCSPLLGYALFLLLVLQLPQVLIQTQPRWDLWDAGHGGEGGRQEHKRSSRRTRRERL